MSAERAFEELARRFAAEPGVDRGTGFGSSPGLRVHRKIFAMLVNGALVVKLPKRRVDELVAEDAGTRFDGGRDRPMKEWVTIPATHRERWEPLALEAFRFVGSGPRRP
jgi:hypothetical protein